MSYFGCNDAPSPIRLVYDICIGWWWDSSEERLSWNGLTLCKCTTHTHTHVYCLHEHLTWRQWTQDKAVMESMECPRLFICSPGYAQHFLDITLKNKSQNTEMRFCHDFNGALWHKYNFCNCTSASITHGKIVTYFRRQIKGIQLLQLSFTWT